MSGEFGKRAKEPEAFEATIYRLPATKRLAIRCWPELIALYEAAQKLGYTMSHGYEKAADQVTEVRKAVQALDSKAVGDE